RQREGLRDRGSQVCVRDVVVVAREGDLASQVLEDGSKERPERPADYRLLINAIGEADTWRDIVLRCLDVERRARILARNQHLSSRCIEAAVNIICDLQRRLILPAQAEVQRQRRRYLVVVLGEDTEVPVAAASGRHRLLVASCLDLAEQEISEAGGGVAGVSMIGDGAVEAERTFRA